MMLCSNMMYLKTRTRGEGWRKKEKPEGVRSHAVGEVDWGERMKYLSNLRNEGDFTTILPVNWITNFNALCKSPSGLNQVIWKVIQSSSDLKSGYW